MTLERGGNGLRREKFCAIANRCLQTLRLTEPSPAGADVLSILEEIGRTSEGYLEAWDRFTAHLAKARERVGATLLEETPSPTPMSEVDDFIAYVRGARVDARPRMRNLGVILHTPLERAFRQACAFARNIPIATVNEETVKDFLQQLYDEHKVAGEVLSRVRGILEAGKCEANEGEIVFLMDTLDRVHCTDAAKRLVHRGVRINGNTPGAQRGRIQRGDSPKGVRGRGYRLEELAVLSPMRREEERIRLAEERGFPYAGRRRDIKDMNGHHPFITSIYAANLARQLHRDNKKWLYRPQAFLVPKGTGDHEGQFLFEPEFYLPQEDLYLVLLTDRRSSGPGGRSKEKVALKRFGRLDRISASR